MTTSPNVEIAVHNYIDISLKVDAKYFQNCQSKSSAMKDCRLYDVFSMHVSCGCDAFDKNKQYVGFMLYYVNGSRSHTFRNGRKVQAGYIYIKEVSALEKFPDDTQHARCMRSLCGDEMVHGDIIACGFSYNSKWDRRWRERSGTFNEFFITAAKKNLPVNEFSNNPERDRQMGHYEELAISSVLIDCYMNGNYRRGQANMKVKAYSEFKTNLFEEHRRILPKEVTRSPNSCPFL